MEVVWMKAKVLVDRDFFRKYYLLLRNVMIIGEAHTHLTPSHCPPVLHDFQNIHALTSAVETCATVQRVSGLLKHSDQVKGDGTGKRSLLLLSSGYEPRTV